MLILSAKPVGQRHAVAQYLTCRMTFSDRGKEQYMRLSRPGIATHHIAHCSRRRWDELAILTFKPWMSNMEETMQVELVQLVQ